MKGWDCRLETAETETVFRFQLCNGVNLQTLKNMKKKGAQKSLISSSWKKNVYNPKVERLEIGEKPEQISPKTTEKRKRDIKVSLCL